MPALTPIATSPNENHVTNLKAQDAPSPQAVHEFSETTNAISTDKTTQRRSDVISDLISDQLVTQYVCQEGCGNGALFPALPQDNELEPPKAHQEDASLDDKTFNTFSNTDTTRNQTSTTNQPSTPHQISNQDPWSTSSSSPPQTIRGPPRTITFHTDSLGLKLSRHTDGHVRILSISPFRSADGIPVREGIIHENDLLLSVGDVDLSHPIHDGHVWKLIVGYIKMAPRPLTMVVCTEFVEVSDVTLAECAMEGEGMRKLGARCEVTGQTIVPSSPREKIGETRMVVFYDESLGVKLRHTARGYVVIHSVTEMSKDNNGKDRPSRIGELKPGDIVLEVGGVWDLYHPISINAWGILVKFIRECRRPMRMVVAEEEYVMGMRSPGSCSEESGEDSVMTPCSVGDDGMDRIEEGDDEVEENESKSTLVTADDESFTEQLQEEGRVEVDN